MAETLTYSKDLGFSTSKRTAMRLFRDYSADMYAGGSLTSKQANIRKRRHRTLFDEDALSRLEMVFAVEQYPDIGLRENLAQELDIPEARIQTWFQNKRSRTKRQQRKLPKDSAAVVCHLGKKSLSSPDKHGDKTNDTSTSSPSSSDNSPLDCSKKDKLVSPTKPLSVEISPLDDATATPIKTRSTKNRPKKPSTKQGEYCSATHPYSVESLLSSSPVNVRPVGMLPHPHYYPHFQPQYLPHAYNLQQMSLFTQSALAAGITSYSPQFPLHSAIYGSPSLLQPTSQEVTSTQSTDNDKSVLCDSSSGSSDEL